MHRYKFIKLCRNYFTKNVVHNGFEQVILFVDFNSNKINLYRKGKEKAQIRCICFEQNNNFIAASSSRGTVHIWSLSTALKNFKKKWGFRR